MKSRIFLLLILLGWSIQNKAQSDYLTPENGYLVQDLVSDYMFSSFEVNNGTLYGFDINGIHAFNAETGELLYTEAKPASYNAQPSFMKVDAVSEYLWMGFTKSDHSDDRIYRFKLSDKSWEHMATFPANFDIEFINDYILISGLNAFSWGDPNGIWLLDLSGNNSHTKIIETGGSSAGLAVDESGNLYYASYSMFNDNFIYKWNSSDVLNVISGVSGHMDLTDATILAGLPAGAFDCDIDDENNLVFNCNDFTNGGFVGIWNGTEGNGENYTSTCTTSEWMTFVKAIGNVHSSGKFYTMAYAKPVAEIKKEIDYQITLENPITDIRKVKNSPSFHFDISSVFAYEGGDLSYEITSNTNESIILAYTNDSEIHLMPLENQSGTASITVTASHGDKNLSDTFEVTLFDYNYEDGTFIVNEDWFGHDEGSVNFFTNEGDFVYRAYRRENNGEKLGVTTQYATTFGEHIILMSKQGNRLVVANRQTLVKEAVFTNIGGDGRDCIGVDENTAYIGTSNGIRKFNLNTLTLGDFIPNISGETGKMIQAEKYVFAINGNNIKIIENHEVIETISGAAFTGIARSKDGNVWVSASSQLYKISPYTLESEIIELPDGSGVAGSSFNAGSLSASTTENSLYWSKDNGWLGSKTIFKYEIGDITSLNSPFATLSDDWVLYGAGLRVHPVSNQVFVSAKKDGWGNNSKYNKLFVLNGETGTIETEQELEEYFWFPALPLMVDKYAPVLSEEINITAQVNQEDVQVDLFDYISDMDNIQAGIEFEIIELSNDDIITASINDHLLDISLIEDSFGDVEIGIHAVSNGKPLDFEVNVTVNELNYTIELVNPITDLRKPKNLNDFTIDLSNVFQYDGGELSYEVTTNSNASLINTNIDGSVLHISASENQLGSATLEVTANHENQEASNEFDIVIFDYNYEDGVFIVNEDWFGHDDGTVNFFTNEGDFVYRAYRNENPGETLGTTTQFATTFADHIFFMSKQGNRLVVVNRQSLIKEAVFTEIGGDGRAFVGVNPEKAYVGTSNGVRILNLNDLSLGNFIPGFSGETGCMLQAEQYVFIINGNKVHILENDEIVESISGSAFAGITRSVDGNVWVGAGTQLLKISPYTLEYEAIDLPNGMTISGSNGVWNAGSLCASNTENALFWCEAGSWGSSQLIYKYEIDDMSSLDDVFHTLPDDWVTYGAGLRVHPVDNHIYITAKKDGWGDNSKFNKLFVVNAETANVETSANLEEYFWFPALPLMADKYAPELSEEISIEKDMNSANIQINLFNYVSDVDNLKEAIEFEITQMSSSDIISAEINDHELEISFLQDAFGDVTIQMQAISNGKVLNFEANVQVNELIGTSSETLTAISCSPNPFNNQLFIETQNNTEYEVEIFSINGQLVHKELITGTTYLDLSSLDKGSYLLKLISKEETYTQKVIKN